MSNVVSISEAVASAQPVVADWPLPTPLPTRLLDVPEFDIDLLPSRLRGWAGDISDRLVVPPDYAAVPLLVGAGAAIGSKMAIRPQGHTSWSETFNLFGVIIGPPSALKTPTINEAIQPLRRIEARLTKEFQNASAHYEMEMAAYKIRADVAEKQARKHFAEGNEEEGKKALNLAEPNAPPQHRLIASNVTVEKLGELCRDNPNGILIDSDEVVTFLNDLSAPEKEMARGFVLSAWGGQNPYVFDRIVRGTVRIERATLSMIGTSQPDIWSRYVRETLTRRPDGLLQRVQCLSWPDPVREFRNVDRAPNSAAREDAFNCIEELHSLIPDSVGAMSDSFDGEGGIPFLRFEPDALERFTDWRAGLATMMRDPDISPALEQHFGKYRGLAARLAGVVHMASGEYGAVGDKAVEKVIGLMTYFEAHARRAYGAVTIDNCSAARAILNRIARGQLQDGFTAKDIYKNCWSGLENGPRLTEALKLLSEYDWLREVRVGTGGKPKVIYMINPAASGMLNFS